MSSSAHLILARVFFGFDGEKFGLPFDVAVHVGTLLAVLIYFRRDFVWLVAAAPRVFHVVPGRAGGARLQGASGASGSDIRDRADEGARFLWLLAVGTVPAVVVGLLFENAIETHLRSPQVAAAMLALGAVGLLVVERLGEKHRDSGSLTLAEAFGIGCAQAAALVPGVSRAGATITVALLLGVRRTEAARFIFLLGIPAILAAAVKETPALLYGSGGAEVAVLVPIGVVSSAVVGYLAIRFFVRYLATHSLDAFAWYRLVLAAAVVVWVWQT